MAKELESILFKYRICEVVNFSYCLALIVGMGKVRDGSYKKENFRQLSLYNDITDLGGYEDSTSKLTPECAQGILKEHGLDVSLEQAAAILCFLRRLASISLTQILKK